MEKSSQLSSVIQTKNKSGTSHLNKDLSLRNLVWRRAREQRCNYMRALLEWEVSFGDGDPTDVHLIKSAGDGSVCRNLVVSI